jgi:hypothetical protein
VRAGRWFPVPESPADLRRLWREAKPLAAADLPEWLSAADAADYRRIASRSLADLPADQWPAAEEEFAELELARLIVADDPRDLHLRHLFMRRPEAEPEWSIGICRGAAPWLPAHPLPARPVLTAADITDVPASGVADPFLLHRHGLWHMFFEVINWRSWKGEIGHATSHDGREWRYRGIVLAEPFHLSYPHVFEHDGRVYMIPESSQASAVRLYRARRFPDDWEHVGDLLGGLPFADATALHHAGRWWLWTETSGSRHDTLRLYHAPDLAGPWQEHPHSPVLAGDPTAARPAGRIIATGERLVRFAQDCTPAYGTAVHAREIVGLSPTAYVERPLTPAPLLGPAGSAGSGAAAPPWNAAGMHHLDAVVTPAGDWLMAIDGWRWPADPA